MRISDWSSDVCSSDLKPGNKLPSEKQLGEQFSVSRSVVREALSQLKSEGLISSQQGRGVFVNERGTRQTFRLDPTRLDAKQDVRSEERRVGKEWVSTCRSRRSRT